MLNHFLSVSAFVLVFLIGCKSLKEAPVPTAAATINFKGPVTIVYKTKADYDKNVAVTLSDDKQTITSYPAPGDVYYNGKLAYPTPLNKGYLLDNRGISINTAFLKMTYGEYSKLTTVPGTDELYKMIIDKDPITEMYNLGNRNRFTDPVKEINAIIKNGELKNYKKLK